MGVNCVAEGLIRIDVGRRQLDAAKTLKFSALNWSHISTFTGQVSTEDGHLGFREGDETWRGRGTLDPQPRRTHLQNEVVDVALFTLCVPLQLLEAGGKVLRAPPF